MKINSVWLVLLIIFSLAGAFYYLKTQTNKPITANKSVTKEIAAAGIPSPKEEAKPAVILPAKQEIVGKEITSKSAKEGKINPFKKQGSKAFGSERENESSLKESEEADQPDQFSRYFKDITTRIGEEESGYKMNYKTVELEKAVQRAKKSPNATGSLNWIQRGPANVSGRTRALIVDPDDATHNTWFAGAVSGGLWKTTDGGATWKILSNEFANISSMAMAASSHNVLYVGTGESFPGGTGMFGNGIWKSTDRGVSWLQLESTATNADFEFVNRLIVDPADENIVLAATKSGVLKSTDGGLGWTKVYADHNVEDLVADPTSFNTLFGGVNSFGIIRSTDAGETWSASNEGIAAGVRYEIAVSPVDHNNVFVSASVSSTASRVYFSNDNGLTWKIFNDAQNFLSGQGDYDNAIAAHPYNADEVYVAGVDTWKLKFNGVSTTTNIIKNCFAENTSFLSFINFSGDFLGGGMNSTVGTHVQTLDWTSVEIRFGQGLTQKAHRFVVPDNSTSGVPAADYKYTDYVDVPFQVWDVTKNRQLMVSFRDQEKDGAFNLYGGNTSNVSYGALGREYIYVHAIPYDSVAPNLAISTLTTGGHLYKTLYMFWPTLADGATWDAANLPTSKVVVDYGKVTNITGVKTSVADAYGFYGGPNAYNQTGGVQTTDIPGPHPDVHNITIIPLGNGNFKMVGGNDGGLSVSNNNGATFNEIRSNYITTQFYGVAKNPDKNEYIGGMQDNGTWQSPPGEDACDTSKYYFQLMGDGFECLWHANNANNILGSIYSNVIGRSSDGGISWVQASGIEANDGPFITKLSVSMANPDLVFAVGNAGLYRSTDFGENFSLYPVYTNWAINSIVSSSHHVEVSRANGNIVWAGGGMATSSGLQMQVSTDNGLNFNALEDYSLVDMNAHISGLATHPTEDSTAFVLFSLRGAPKVLRTRDLGMSWEDISGFGTNKTSSNGFPDVIVNCLLVMPYNPNIIWVGTEIGLFESTDNGENWHVANNGLPPLAVYQMKISGDQVVMASHGRGIWSVTIPELNNTPFVIKFAQLNATHLSLSANLKVVYDSVEIYLDNTLYSTETDTYIGENIFPLSTKLAGNHVAYIVGYIDGVAFRSNIVYITSIFAKLDPVSEISQTGLYPNPAGSFFMFDLDEKYNKYKIELFSLSGQKVLSLENSNAINNKVDVSSLMEGNYVVNLNYGTIKETKKLIISR